jgi:hypothetical protein
VLMIKFDRSGKTGLSVFVVSEYPDFVGSEQSQQEKQHEET